ncbi:lysophospholipid acyltransferase family protein [Rhodovulum adriaticum]|uniref:1-acyl-sn-glycerol-3-phosphate acyltransferase n=1 Tax=Rhodovulum adriaticum TaxID=35804 RepID=A0A4R2NKL4_RHOAD|nr:lysophospholipid acyltransferase family protein [Rhodovulum adriaticum]MBK1635485.1 1-acyl-sn-glycerol-3-phosphate acyltransferase [Rhodovulum adriaticum]TCP22057.1 1-acyl-sn-glycerol-3-phosphate acyltransferase [Rhodovulum adriaticum]
MRYALQYLRSLLFVGQMYLAMPIFALVYTIPAMLSRDWAFHAVHHYCHYVRWTARWMIGLRSEIRGTPPSGEVLIASKHQSFFDIIMLVSVVPRPRFIMKKSLKWAPILGWYAMRIGCIPVDRGKRGQAIQDMVKRVAEGRQAPGQLIIYPQGTRVAPDATRPYKIGTGVLYDQFGHDCVPAATNVGVFWPRTGIYRKPGLAVLEFLPTIPGGKPVDTFMEELEATVEGASDRLMAEAGFDAPAARAAQNAV